MNLISKTLRTALILLPFVFFTLSIFGQSTEMDLSAHVRIEERTNQIFDSLVKIRRDFHVNPELGEKEERTAEKIAEYLNALGLEVHTNIGGYGVVGILRTNRKGKRIAWRTDIDALASEHPDVVEFSSENEGVRHICGHDVHTTIALGMANVLTSLKESLTGTIYFIFQPSEENWVGAKAMIDDGVFDLIDPEEIYALHIAPMAEGNITTKARNPFADHKGIQITFKKSDDNEAVIDYAKKLILNLQNVAPDSKFWDNRSLLDPNIGLGNPNTIFKDYVTVDSKVNVEQTENEIIFRAALSAEKETQLDSLLSGAKEKIMRSKFSSKFLNIKFYTELPLVLNDENLTNISMAALSKIYGKEKNLPLYGAIPDGRSDDFSLFQRQIPGVYFLLGASDFQKGIISMPHSPNFSVDENSIRTGVQRFSSLLVERLK